MPKSKERILDDAKQLNEEDLLWFISELIKYLGKDNEENKEDELGEDAQPIIPLQRLQINDQVTKSKRKRLRFNKRLEKALNNSEDNSDLSILVKNASRALKKEVQVKE